MRKTLQQVVARVLRASRLALLPVRVRAGVAAGARWTLFPWSAYWRGTHEPQVQAAILAVGGGAITGWSCWDLGAHFGIYSIGLARRVGPTGEVASFEPDPTSFARLRRHARMNRLSWLKLYQAAVSDRAGTAELYTYGETGSTAAHLAYEGEPRQANCTPQPIAIVRLDELVERGELRPPDFVKIDVEGHAHSALAGMAATLRRARPILIVAIHSVAESEGVLNLLQPLGYRFSAIGPGSAAPWIGEDLLFTPAPPAARA